MLKKRKGKKLKLWVTIAAAILILVISGVWYYRSFLDNRSIDETSLLQSEERLPSGTISLPPVLTEALQEATPTLGIAANDSETGEAVSPISKEQEPVQIYVYLCGSVLNAGVYAVPEGSRLVDAITCAGGFSKDAAKEYHNLARLVYDGERIYVPSKEELQELTKQQQITGSQVITWIPMAEDTGSERGSSSDSDSATTVTKVNINTAGEEELTTLPGIGQSRAKDIIEYRTKVGLFTTIEDIMNVSGIGEAMFQKMEDYITIQ